MASEPRSRPSQPHGAKRLRSSCDACGFAKTKCDRGQPQCGRCISLDLNCIYGPSRQSGKKPRRRLVASRTSSNGIIQGNHDVSLSGNHIYNIAQHASHPNPSNGGGLQYASQPFPPNVSINNNNINGPIPPDEPNLSNLLPAGNDPLDHMIFTDLDIWAETGPQQFNDFTAPPTSTSYTTLPP